MSPIIGIDLGTTFSAVGMVQAGVPHIIPHGEERIMPSVVGFTPQDTMLVGTPARNQLIVYPELTIKSVKRQMGMDTRITLGQRSYTPQEISGIILRELKQSVEARLGEPVERAVITVPAYFSDSARQATYEAGEVAGLTVERIINEPTAAALAYGLDRVDEHQFIAVYDLGGGTFDVSIIEMDAGVVEVRASHGNTQLGGDDFDDVLMNHLADHVQAQHGVDPRDDRRALARLSRAAESAKIALSSEPFVTVREEYLLTHQGKPIHLDMEVSRIEFEALIAPLLEGTLQSLDAALTDADLSADEIDRILLVGGSTRIPLVWDMVREHTGIEPEATVNPDEAVALGAAIQAAIIAGEPLDAILVDVTPHSLGIEVAELQFGRVVPDRYSIIIHRNTTIPTSRSEVYSAVFPEQKAIEIKVYQGEHPIASQNRLLGDFLFDDLKSESSGMPPRVTVQFDFDVNGILHVSAVDRGSGKQANITVRAARAQLSPAEIEQTRASLDEMETVSHNGHGAPFDEDTSIIEASAETNVELLALLSRARRIVKHSTRDTSALQTAITALEQAIRRGDEDDVELCAEDLLDALYELDDDEEEEV